MFLLTPHVLIVDDSPSDLGLMKAHVAAAKPEWRIDTARTGEEALTKMEAQQPDIVVTDLRMPQMDGIALLTEILQKYPDIPTIIATARGSEGLAVQALDAGAASYVPKSQMDLVLVETIEQVLERIQADHNYQQLISGLNRTTYEFKLPNDPALIAPLVDLLQQMAFGMEIVDATERRQLGIALDEAILNAMYHGNLELPRGELAAARRQLREREMSPVMERMRTDEEHRDRFVHVTAELTKRRAKFTIKDEGIGFHPNSIPLAHDPKVLEKEGGRGLVLMKNFMDEVTFNELGNEVSLVKSK